MDCRSISANFLSLLSFSLLGGFFVDYIKHLSLDGLFLHLQSILVPDEVWGLSVDAVSFHAPFEKADDISIVWILGEGQTSAVVHELFELFRLVFA